MDILGYYLVPIAIGAFLIFLALAFRRVVEPNEIHIVNRRNKSLAYGRPPVADFDPTGKEIEPAYSTQGNAYYEWPSWVPYFGVTKVVVPLTNFDLDLTDYEAYDEDKVPFMVDIKAFFRVSNPIVAAQRIHIHDSEHNPLADLLKQLLGVLEGTSRSILAKYKVKYIMTERSAFGVMFTDETAEQLLEWGITNIKNIELMDVRDATGSEVISNIMAMKESEIEKQSRVEVAGNKQQAQEAEIAAQQAVDVKDQQAQQIVGERTAEKVQKVGEADEQAMQKIKIQMKITAEKDMDVLKVNEVRTADIAKDVAVVEAQQSKEVAIVNSEGDKQSAILVADGDLYEQERIADGKLAVGTAEAEAERLGNMAEVTPQLELADGIGENIQYQDYMVRIRDVEKNEAVGVEQAKALQAADIKVIANTGDVTNGVNSAMELFSSKGGTAIGSMLEAAAQTPAGKAVIDRVVQPNGTAET